MEFLSDCRRTRWARKGVSPEATFLAEAVTMWANAENLIFGSIPVGAVIAAAQELGIIVVPDGERDALVGVNHSDVCARTTGKTPLVPEPMSKEQQEEEWFKNYMRENGIVKEGEAEPIEFMTAIKPPSPRKYAVPDRIPSGQVNQLSGGGGVGKSILTLQLGCATVLARDWLGSQPEPGPFVCMGAEDEADEIHRRIEAIAEHYGASLSDVIDNGFYASSYAGKDMTLARFDRQGRIEPTPLYAGLLEQACDLRPVILALDTLSAMLVGRHFEEETLIRAAQALEILQGNRARP